uniref:Core-binding (CB) domain-containing protein n=1 Tax=mine drainage metagenome TaxID=410659 RepID=E6QJL4_9ZZZZ
MMEELIKRPTTLARYLGGPLAEERDNFLKHCAQVGYSPSMLKKISWVIWAVAEYIGIDHGKVTMQDIRIAVDHRTRFKRQSTQTKESKSTRQMFIHFATEWARHMGCLGQAAKLWINCVRWQRNVGWINEFF